MLAKRGGGAGKAVHAAHELQEFGARQTVEEQRFIGHQADPLLDFEFSGGKFVPQDLHLNLH